MNRCSRIAFEQQCPNQPNSKHLLAPTSMQATMLPGTGNFESAEATKEKESANKAAKVANARQEMLDVRASLPVFKYREQLLQAVEEHQVGGLGSQGQIQSVF